MTRVVGYSTSTPPERISRAVFLRMWQVTDGVVEQRGQPIRLVEVHRVDESCAGKSLGPFVGYLADERSRDGVRSTS
jgi:hypothetical protein